MSLDRRAAILRFLSNRHSPITGAELAQHFDVSRQVIVQDIALLRAQGATVVATPRGYLYGPAMTGNKFIRRLTCRNAPGQTRLGLATIVKAVCRVVDVIVEHPLYGKIRAL